jgi:hypothetical protein
LNLSLGFHELQVLDIIPGLRGLPEFACFFFPCFKLVFFLFFSCFFKDFCFVIFYGLSSMVLFSSSWPKSLAQRLTQVDFYFFLSFLKLIYFNFIIQHLMKWKLVFVLIPPFLFYCVIMTYVCDREVSELTQVNSNFFS